MRCYKLKHIPSGLYFIPGREVSVKLKDKNGQLNQRWVKSNLSKKGKIYQQRPTLRWLGDIFYTHLGEWESEFSGLPYTKKLRVRPEEWEVEVL
jgi:hypothetical protein